MKLTAEGKERLPDLVKFGRHMLLSEDIDPLYPVLRYLQRGMSAEAALWHTFLYVAWYNLPSATAALRSGKLPNTRVLDDFDPSWPTGIERRANRGGKVGVHIASYIHFVKETHPNQMAFLTHGHLAGTTQEELHANWRMTNEALQSVFGNGRWAAYKHLEVLRRVNSFLIEAPDMGHQFSSGPREGLCMLYGDLPGEKKEVIDELDRRGLDLQEQLAKRGLEMDIEELETLLCNWKSLVKGKYYVGHDIDELQEQIEVLWKDKDIINDREAQLIWTARYETLPHEYLGELNERHGVQKKRMAAYRDRRKILIRRAA